MKKLNKHKVYWSQWIQREFIIYLYVRNIKNISDWKPPSTQAHIEDSDTAELFLKVTDLNGIPIIVTPNLPL